MEGTASALIRCLALDRTPSPLAMKESCQLERPCEGSQGLRDLYTFAHVAMHGEGRNTCSFSKGKYFLLPEMDRPSRYAFDSKWDIKDRLDLRYKFDPEPHSASFVLHDFVNWAAHDIHDIGFVFLMNLLKAKVRLSSSLPKSC